MKQSSEILTAKTKHTKHEKREVLFTLSVKCNNQHNYKLNFIWPYKLTLNYSNTFRPQTTCLTN